MEGYLYCNGIFVKKRIYQSSFLSIYFKKADPIHMVLG